VRLTAGGRVFRQPINVRLDPRVKTPAADLTLQFTLSKAVDSAMRRLAAARADLRKALASEAAESAALEARLKVVSDALAPLQGLFESLQEADVRPTAPLEAAVKEALARADAALATS
jgi:hypothetical protein